MSNSELTRRKLLAGLAAAGGAGAGVGTGTSALLTDEVGGLGATLAAGTLDLNIACSGDSCTETKDGTVSLTPTIQSGYGGDENVEVSSDLALRLDDDSNPAYVWMRIGCVDIDEENDLAEMLHLTITFDDENELLDKPLIDIGGDVERLIPVGDQDTLLPERGEGNPYPLSFTWELAENDVRTSRGGQEGDEFENDLEVDLPVEFKAVQSRHSNPTPPFDQRLSCDDTESSEGCKSSKEMTMGGKDVDDEIDMNIDGYSLKIEDANYKNKNNNSNNPITDVKISVLDDDGGKAEICEIHTKHEGEESTFDNFTSRSPWVEAPKKSNNKSKRITHMTVSVCTADSGNCQSTGG